MISAVYVKSYILSDIILESKKEISGVILSGGKSIRMGKNKAFIQVEGVPIIERIHTYSENYFRKWLSSPMRKICFQNFDSKIFSDLIPTKGH